MRTTTLALGLCLTVARLHAQTPSDSLPDAATIMARVAGNPDRSFAERAHYVYVQHARVISRKGNTVHRKETAGFTPHIPKLRSPDSALLLPLQKPLHELGVELT